MDFIKSEEKLIRAELTVRDTIKKKETLAKIDAILSKYNKENRTEEKLAVTIKTCEQLSKEGKLKLPLFIKGKMLGVGRHKEKFYTEYELMAAVKKFEGKKFPLKLDHRDKEAASTIGMVDTIYWNPKEKAIMYEAHVNSDLHARNILDGAHKDVSATIYSVKDVDPYYGIVGLDLDFTELSIVHDGAYAGNTLEVSSK
jgi:hypothetical protein